MKTISDARVAAVGESHYVNAEPSLDAEAVVSGTIFEITEQELAAARTRRPDHRAIRLCSTEAMLTE